MSIDLVGVSISSRLLDVSAGLSPARSAASALSHTSSGSGRQLQGLLCVRARGGTQEQSDPRAGAWAGRPLEGLSVVGAQAVKKLHLLAGFWVGLRNSFTPLLFHTAFLRGSTLDFTIYWTILKNCSKVDWIWAAAGPVFQHLYFQLVCQILFQTFHSFVLCNFFFNELAWGAEFSHI